jgi:ribulose 1,5-bisphosphate synthetase/thiazole synthase
MGMVGLIVVGTDPTNVTAAQEIRQPGKAKSVFEQLLSQL